MNYLWKKLGPQYDEELVREFRKENEKHGKTLDYTTSEVKFKTYWATNAVKLVQRQNSTGFPFQIRNVRVPVPLVGVGGAVCGLLFTLSVTHMASKVLFKDKGGDKKQAMVAFSEWLKERNVD